MTHRNMWDERFIRLKNAFIEIILTIKRMICNCLMTILQCFWIVISFQEENFITNAKKLAEKIEIILIIKYRMILFRVWL